MKESAIFGPGLQC